MMLAFELNETEKALEMEVQARSIGGAEDVLTGECSGGTSSKW